MNSYIQLQRVVKRLDQMRTVILDVAHLETNSVMGERSVRRRSK